ncbi:MAG: response regulator [Sporomusaceae bacterium]|nr:response regulator [Sporomusaceae bacterium]
MRFFIVDDDEVIRSMVAEIIEDCELGEVVGEAENGSKVNAMLLAAKAVDILIIDLLMPIKDGIQTVKDLRAAFTGRIIMLSQVEDKETIGNAYGLGVNNYITKPINRLEVISIIQNVMEHIQLQNVIQNIEKNLHGLVGGKTAAGPKLKNESVALLTSGQFLLSELGMIGESGCKDLLDMLEYVQAYEQEQPEKAAFPSLKDIFTNVAMKHVAATEAEAAAVKKEAKALEQRVRRAIFQGLTHLASLGIIDYTNPSFENYAPKFFDFTEVRKIMLCLQKNQKSSISDSKINMKKFVQILYLEAKQEARK